MNCDLDDPDLDDASLVELAARRISLPRAGAADSFVLHAPLELMARAALLRRVPASRRAEARRRIVELVTTHDSYEPERALIARDFRDEDDAASWTAAAIDAGDPDGAQAAVTWLAQRTTATELVARLADVVVARTSAAGHAPIFLWLLPRVLAIDPSAPLLAAPLVRELARRPDWSLTWMDRLDGTTAGPTHDLFDRLLHVPSPSDPGSNYIHPTMSLVERAGTAAEVLGPALHGLDVRTARRDLLRVAALSMLQDDPANAPYGWSHALTMPQAAIGIAPVCARPERALAVAATFVLGFRATQSSVALDRRWVPEPPVPDAREAFLAAGPDVAAATVWHAPEHELAGLVSTVVASAACHEDAHLVKYTLACLDAARDDPEARRLFLAAAAYLAGWWAVHPDA